MRSASASRSQQRERETEAEALAKGETHVNPGSGLTNAQSNVRLTMPTHGGLERSSVQPRNHPSVRRSTTTMVVTCRSSESGIPYETLLARAYVKGA
jgi:hypothetical protein